MVWFGSFGTRVPNLPLRQLIRKACDEIPDVVASTACSVVGLGIIAGCLVYYKSNDLENRRYKFLPVVVRPDDPLALKQRK